MLAFLKNQNSGSTKPKEQDQSKGNENRKEEYLTVSNQDKTVRRSTIVLIALFAIGSIAVLLMIIRISPAAVNAEEGKDEQAKIQKAISHITGVSSEMFDRMDGIVDKFYQFSDVQQVKVNELSRNPFKREVFGEKLSGDSGNELNTSAQMLHQLRRKSEDLQLLSIMRSGQHMCCMINDKILYEGDSINDFTVSEITDKQVQLICNDFKVQLKLTE